MNKLPVLIPNEEYKDRVRRLQQAMAAEDLDAVLCYANFSVYQNVRYLCNYWPMFETGGILVPRKGDPKILIGGEAPGAVRTAFGPENVRVSSDFAMRTQSSSGSACSTIRCRNSLTRQLTDRA